MLYGVNLLWNACDYFLLPLYIFELIELGLELKSLMNLCFKIQYF